MIGSWNAFFGILNCFFWSLAMRFFETANSRGGLEETCFLAGRACGIGTYYYLVAW